MWACYSEEGDVFGLLLARGTPERVEVVETEKGAIYLEFDAEGHLMGLEVVGAKTLIPKLSEFLGLFASLCPPGEES